MNDAPSFFRQAKDTINWCVPRVDPSAPATCLRTTELRPTEFTAENDFCGPIDNDTIHRLVNSRSDALGPRPDSPVSQLSDLGLAGGRLLICDHAQSLFDDMSKDVSDGFIDTWDLPPWDTWIGALTDARNSKQGYLVTWVPSEFIDAIAEARSLACTNIFLWADSLPAEPTSDFDFAGVPRWFAGLPFTTSSSVRRTT